MPGLQPGGMNGHFDHSRFGPDRGYTNGTFDQYNRDDPYRDEMKGGEEDLYRRPTRNGGARPSANDRFGSDHLADQNSLSDFNSSEPAFELDHLATFAAGDVRKGTMHVEDGLRKLRQMENTTGIWTMRCILLVERRFLVILDKNSGEELERFPVQMIHEPTAVFKNDRREIYNNLVLFTVVDESNRKDPHADMHIFQSVRTPAQNIVDEIFASKRGQGRVSSAGEAVLSELFAAHSVKLEGWEGEALRHNVTHAFDHAWASSDQQGQASRMTHQQAGVGQAFAHNALLSGGVTASAASENSPQALSSGAFQQSPHLIGGGIGASTNQNSAQAPRSAFQQNPHLIGGEIGASTNQNSAHAPRSAFQQNPRLIGGGIGASTNQNSFLAPNSNAFQQYPLYVGGGTELGRPAQRSRSPSGLMPGTASAKAPQASPLNDLSGDERNNRRGGASAAHAMHTASDMQNRMHITTQQVTTTTTTNQTHGSKEDGGMSANQLRDGKKEPLVVMRHGYKAPPQPAGPAPDPYDFGRFQETIEQRQVDQRVSQYGASQFSNGGGFLGGAQRSSMMARPTYSPYREREDDFGNNELLERDVQLLNHCFDDIEKFVARLQQAAEAYKELEKRKRERGGKGKKPMGGDGMLGHRARPPPAQDFVDIFQKFKLSFNLLAKLKAHIHDPNAPELVHFLFTPLSLIYEASRDPVHGSANLGEQAVAPVLTLDAKQLLLNCLTSKEIELWQALGKNWTTSKDEWKGYMPPYVPRFYDGWQPAPTLVEEPPASRANLESAVAAHHNQILNRQREQDVRDYVRERVVPFPPEEERFPHELPRSQDYQRFEPELRAPSPPRDAMSNPSVIGYQQYVEQHIDRNYQANHRRAPEPAPQPPPPASQPPKQLPPDDNVAYLEELKKTGAKVYEVAHDRQGKNAKELTVNKGDYLQVLDSSRNWWKVRNYKGQTGYTPYTILKEVPYSADQARDQGTTETGAIPPSDRGNKREMVLEEQEMRFASNPGMSPRYGRPRDSPIPRRFDDMDIPVLSPEEEEEEERHAFRPVEPSVYNSKVIGAIRPTQPQIDLHNELRSKMGHGQRQQRGEERRYAPETYQPPNPPASSITSSSPPGSTTGGQAFYITRSSSHIAVSSWLESKGFSTLCRTTLQGFTGADVFSLHRQEMEQLIGHDEAARLEGQLTLQKKMTGYKTQSAAELNAIFQKRRARSDLQGAALGQPPDYRPQSPSSYDGPDSDSDSGDRQLAETGKTLRDLLIRQRQKIIDSNVFHQQ